MDHPIISSANGKARHNEMIQAANNYRRVKQLQQSNESQLLYLARFFGFLASLFRKSENVKVVEPITRTS